jgi:hypothetical protein
MVAKSKWDAENLHRHTEYAPVKKEPALHPADLANSRNDSLGKRSPTLSRFNGLICLDSYAQSD